MLRRYVTVLIAALALGACSKSEQASQKPQARVEAPQASPDSGKTQEEIDAGLKERLARQEAASKMFEKSVLEPTPPKAAEPKRADAPKAGASPAPAPAAAPPAEAPKQAAPAVVPPAAPAKAPESVKAEPPKAEPPKAEAPPKAAPTPAAPAKAGPAAPSTAARLITRVDPEFPREALQAGAEKGVVRVKLSIDEGGNVTRVEVVDATPRRIFDRAVVRALSQWKFSEGAAGRSVETEVEFKR